MFFMHTGFMNIPFCGLHFHYETISCYVMHIRNTTQGKSHRFKCWNISGFHRVQMGNVFHGAPFGALSYMCSGFCSGKSSRGVKRVLKVCR